ncbi:MAG: hypothetical protein JW793_01755 [Acidobacteria bacterium]|nr:hypothetical protein [Acidobacteriota bacterium]
MRRFFPVSAVTGIAVMAIFSWSGCSPSGDAAETRYEVLSPWAEVDPIPLRGISARVDTLEGKKIGLFANFKRAAVPIAREVEKKLKERFPDSEISLYHSTAPNVDESVEPDAAKFEAWAKELDAVIAMVGD